MRNRIIERLGKIEEIITDLEIEKDRLIEELDELDRKQKVSEDLAWRQMKL